MGRKRSLISSGWVPNQHGAWPMTIGPPIVGMVLGGFTGIQLWLALTWLVAFLFFNAFGFWVKGRQKKRYLAALTTYGVSAGISAAVLVAVRPSLLWWGLPLGICFIAAAYEIFHRRERSLLARLSTIGASCLVAPATYALGSHPNDWHRLTVVTLLLAAYFAGTVPYVKTMIRERGTQRWLFGSWIFHGVMLLVTIVLCFTGEVEVFVPLSWMVLLGRAWAFPNYSAHQQRRISAKVIGISEIGFCLLVMVTLLI